MKKEISVLIVLIAIFSFVLVSTAQAAEGDLGDASTTPGNLYGGSVSSYSVSFKTHEPLPKQAGIRLIFPDGFNVSGATATSSILVTYAGSPIVGTSTVSGQEITLDIDDGTDPIVASTTIHISGIPNIQTPSAGGSFTLGVITRSNVLASGTVDSASSTAFSIFGGQPGRPSLYSDAIPPTSKIMSPTDGLTISVGEKYAIQGTASDQGGSTVQKVEVSLDGGQNWSMAEIKSALANVFSWEYVWQNPTKGEYVIKVRATDAVGNIESALTGARVTVSVPIPPTLLLPEKPITEMTVQELETKITEIQQKIIDVLGQLIQLFQQQIQALLAK